MIAGYGLATAALGAALLGVLAGRFIAIVVGHTPEIIGFGNRHVTFSAYMLALWRVRSEDRGQAKRILVQGACALSTLLTVFLLGISTAAVFVSVFALGLLALTFIDVETQILPDVLVFPLLVLGLVFGTVCANGPLNATLGAVAGFGALWLVRTLYRFYAGIEGMGYGDLKLSAAIGAWIGLGAVPTMLLIAFASGTSLMLTLMLAGRISDRTPVPFGPFLALGGICVLLFPRLAALPMNLFPGPWVP